MKWIPECVERTARKHWECEGNGRGGYSPECLKTSGDINPGDRYVEYLGETPAYQSGSRHCLHCAKMFCADEEQHEFTEEEREALRKQTTALNAFMRKALNG